ncbi:uncharacterized protein B0H18DRAFT_993532 [Fomitopsis serialis]|uniref:uncharacterized protein n=1 Tax=Fomitopsis serialis TaxID=139415 RepID=UPI0020072643|nr:uncharacterized protein B0H18DRAFT_993532 [Neoantrodia serialis]KAH9930778.1 hypothetical protein B0H18DRAFT_993532 [Neoantrodia serialis]
MCSLIFVFAALSAIRVLSLNFYGFDWKLPALVSSVVLFQFGTDIYTYSRSRSVVLLAPPYCTMQYTVPVDLDYRRMLVLRRTSFYANQPPQ